MLQGSHIILIGSTQSTRKIWSAFINKHGGSVVECAKTSESAILGRKRGREVACNITHVVVDDKSITTLTQLLSLLQMEEVPPSCFLVTGDWLIQSIKTKQRAKECEFSWPASPCSPCSSSLETSGKQKKARPNSCSTEAVSVKQFLRLGGVDVVSIGIGTLPWAVLYPDPDMKPSRDACKELLRAALSILDGDNNDSNGAQLNRNHDVRLFLDTADSYCEGKSDFGSLERLLPELLREVTNEMTHGEESFEKEKDGSQRMVTQAVIGTKGGMSRKGTQSTDWMPVSARYGATASTYERLVRASHSRLSARSASDSADALATKNAAAECAHAPNKETSVSSSSSSSGRPSAQTEPIFLWQLHHCLENPLQQQVLELLATLRDEEHLVRSVGICNANLDQVRQAVTICGIVSVQNQFNVFLGKSRLRREVEIIEYCRENGLIYMA